MNFCYLVSGNKRCKIIFPYNNVFHHGKPHLMTQLIDTPGKINIFTGWFRVSRHMVMN